MKHLAWIGSLLAALLLTAGPALADHPDSKSEIESLKARIEALESGTEAHEEEAPFQLSADGKVLTFSGLLELQASYLKAAGSDAVSDITLATAELSTEVAISHYVGGHVILLWEEGAGPVDVDEAVIVLHCPSPLLGQKPSLVGGRLYLPFGRFSTAMVTDPLTLDLGETTNTALVVGLEGETWNLKGGVFNGAVDAAGDSDSIDAWTIAADVTPIKDVTFGVSYSSDLAESGAELVQDPALYSDDVPALAGFVAAQVGPVGLFGEYVAALQDFDAALLPLNPELSGERPSTWSLELSWQLADDLQLAARADAAKDYRDDLRRYGATVSYGVVEDAVLSLEYLLGDPQDAGAVRSQAVTAQLAFEF